MARTAEHTARGPGAELLARLGYVAKGVVYLIIGVLAVRVAIGDGGKTTDNRGALQAIYHQPLGQFLLGVMVVGLLGYALWCLILRALLDADDWGTKPKGVVARLGYAVVGIAYAATATAAIQLLAGAGSAGKSTDASAQDWTATLIKHAYGMWLVILLGLVMIAVGLYLLYYAYSADFMQRFSSLTGGLRRWVQRLGRAGYTAQGLVFGEIGIFLIVAASRHNPREAKGLGGALQQLATAPYGHVLLAFVALGFIAYGVYSFAQARYRRIATC
jgi:hypothetical protein